MIVKMTFAILLVAFIASFVCNIVFLVQDRKVEQPNTANDHIKQEALRDLDMTAPIQKITLTQIHKDGDNVLYTMLIPDQGLYLVGVNFVNGEPSYVDVEKKLV